MRALLLLLVAAPAFAVSPRDVEDACFEKIKPLVKDKATKVMNVQTKAPDGTRRNSVWHVTFEFNRKLRNDSTSAWCMFKPDGTLWSDDYSKYVEQEEKAKRWKEEEARAKAEQKKVTDRFNSKL